MQEVPIAPEQRMEERDSELLVPKRSMLHVVKTQHSWDERKQKDAEEMVVTERRLIRSLRYLRLAKSRIARQERQKLQQT